MKTKLAVALSAAHTKEHAEKQIAKVLKSLPALPAGLDESEKEDQMAKREMLESIIMDLMLESDQMLSTHNGSAKRKEAKAKKQHSDVGLLPDDMERIGKIPEPVLVDTLANLGDMTSDDIICCNGFDSSSDTQLTTFSTAMAPGYKLSSCFRVPGRLGHAMAMRHSALGNRLALFKPSGGFSGGRLN